MAVKFKDYYEVLKISPTASEGEIKSAYRRLARKHHPDLVSFGKKAAEEQFKEINEAYEVLGDQEKKEKYDALSARKGEVSARPSASKGGVKKDKKTDRQKEADWEEEEEEAESAPHKKDVFSDFFESIFGAEKPRTREPGTFGRRKESARTYTQAERGKDIESQMELTLEEIAHGTKRSIFVDRSVSCVLCEGSGFINRQGCIRCKSTGHLLKTKELTVTIPEGIKQGDKVRLSGQGENGTGGGEAGDRFIEVKFRPHAVFTVEDEHLQMGLDVTPWEAVLGADLKITTLYGDVILKVPSGSQNGQKFRLRGKGLPLHKGERQDLYVRIAVNLPSSITQEERQHYLELAKLAKKR
jgi:curved DNA-binding protein